MGGSWLHGAGLGVPTPACEGTILLPTRVFFSVL